MCGAIRDKKLIKIYYETTFLHFLKTTSQAVV